MIRSIASYHTKRFFESKNPFLWVFGVKFFYSTLAGIIVGYFDPTATDLPIDDENVWYQFSVSVIMGPILETLLFQVLIIEVMRSFKVKDIYMTLASGLLFSFSHSYNITYILVTFIAGLLYAFYYITLRRNNDWFFSAAFVFFIHSLYNFFVLLTKL